MNGNISSRRMGKSRPVQNIILVCFFLQRAREGARCPVDICFAPTVVKRRPNPFESDWTRTKKKTRHKALSVSFFNVRERIRTPDTLVRSQVLYPAELRTRTPDTNVLGSHSHQEDDILTHRKIKCKPHFPKFNYIGKLLKGDSK